MTPAELDDALTDSADPNAQDGTSCVLGAAARSPFTDDSVVAKLLAAGTDVNPRPRHSSGYFWPPLLQAAHQSTNAKIQMLLDAGADASVIDEHNHWTVLGQLASWASLENIRNAIRAGGRLDRGHPLHIAVWAGRVEVVALLLEHGADPNVRAPGH